MSDILSITAPIYLIVAVGYLCTRAGLFARADMRLFGKFVVTIALPALLFNALSQRSVAEVLNPVFVGAYAIGSLVALGVGVFWARQLAGKRISEAAILGMGMASPNSGFIGFPLVAQLFGPVVGGIGLALAMVVEVFLTLPLALAIAESELGEGAAGATRAARWRMALAQSLRGTVRNPMIWGIALGFLFSLLEWRLPAPAAKAVDLFAGATAAVSLFAIGGMLVGIQVRGMAREVFAASTGKLLLHPLAVAAALWLLPPTTPELETAVVVMAAVPMLGIYPLLAQKYGHEQKAAAAQMAATIASFFTLTAVIWFVQR